MARVTMYTELEASPDEVWETIRDFGRPERYMTGVTEIDVEGEGPGAVRTLTLEDGSRVVERLEEVDDEARKLRYVMLESPLPMRDYVGTMQVERREDEGCELQWACRYRPAGATAAEVKSAIQDIFVMGFNGLEELFNE